MIYTPEDLRKRFNVAKETLRQWSIEFAPYLSPSATPTDKGKHRLYTDDDLGVLALVAELKDRGVTFDEIHLALKNGQRGDVPDDPDGLALIPQQQQVALIQARVLELQDEVERLKPFEGQVMVERTLREHYQEQLKIAQEEIARLNREIGKLSKED